MSETAVMMYVCHIADTFARQIGLADFEIERVVHSKSDVKDEWIVQLRFPSPDPLIEDDDHGASIVVDAETEKPRLIEGL